MKKIIKHGQKKEMRTTCPNCGCEFSYEWEDVITTEKSYPYEPT
jgi:RNA polymerase subunit RPABC4/transcription elongation factor Spt4